TRRSSDLEPERAFRPGLAGPDLLAGQFVEPARQRLRKLARVLRGRPQRADDRRLLHDARIVAPRDRVEQRLGAARLVDQIAQLLALDDAAVGEAQRSVLQALVHQVALQLA